jgi:4-amino-4-deoxychorismate lyase
MCLLFESIAVVGGLPQNLAWHEKRMNASRRSLWGLSNKISLENIAADTPKDSTLLKLKVIYGQEIEEVSYEEYHPKPIRSFQLIKSDTTYSHKYLDRNELNALYQEKNGADEIIIIQNKQVTDSSIGNLIFLSEGQWYTPSTPLLPGTMRAKLLNEGQIQEAHITTDSLNSYEKLMVINALNPFDPIRALPISSIRF